MFAFMKMLSDVNELYLQTFPFYNISPPPHALSLYVSSFHPLFFFTRLLSSHNISCCFISLFHQMRTIWQLKIQRKKLLYWPPTVLFCLEFFFLSLFRCCCCCSARLNGHRQWFHMEQCSDADNNLVWWGHAHHMKYVLKKIYSEWFNIWCHSTGIYFHLIFPTSNQMVRFSVEEFRIILAEYMVIGFASDSIVALTM